MPDAAIGFTEQRRELRRELRAIWAAMRPVLVTLSLGLAAMMT